MNISQQEYRTISTHPNLIHDWVIGPNIIIFSIVYLEWKTKNARVEYQIQPMIKLFKIKGCRHMFMILNLKICFQYPPLLQIIIWIICRFFHKIGY